MISAPKARSPFVATLSRTSGSVLEQRRFIQREGASGLQGEIDRALVGCHLTRQRRGRVERVFPYRSFLIAQRHELEQISSNVFSARNPRSAWARAVSAQ